MRRLASSVVLLGMLATPAAAFDLPSDSTITWRARMFVGGEWQRSKGFGLGWDFDTVSGNNPSRAMVEGLWGSKLGTWYGKTEAHWQRTRYERPEWRLEQADVLFELGTLSVRPYLRENRYFSNDVLGSLVSDAYLANRDFHAGLRGDWGTSRQSLSFLWAALNERWEQADRVTWLRAGLTRGSVHTSASYLHNDVPESATEIAALKGEALVGWRRLTASATVVKSGAGVGFGFPEWDSGSGSSPDEWLGERSALAAEGRWRRIVGGEWGRVDLDARYETAGENFASYGGLSPGLTTSTVGIFVPSRRKAVDLRVELTRQTHSDTIHNDIYLAWLRTLLANGNDVLVRVGRLESEAGSTTYLENWVHASVSRATRRIEGAFHAMAIVREVDRNEQRVGARMRLNVSSTVSAQAQTAAFGSNLNETAWSWRLQFRPTQRVLIVAGYGEEQGRANFFLEDLDYAGSGESLYTIMLRGDF